MALHAAAAALATTGGASGSSAITNGVTLLLGIVGQVVDMVIEHPVLSIFFVAGMLPIALSAVSRLKNI